MLYTARNARAGATVHDLDTRERLSRVLAVNTDTGEVTVHCEPWRPVDGKLPTKTIRFQAAWAVMDGAYPCAFHCHGRQN